MTESATPEYYEVFEVFIQGNTLANHIHVGSVVAPSPELALQVARESFLRRESAISIWVVKQAHIHHTSYEEKDFFLNKELDKSYRDVAGYADNARRWKRFKEQAMTIEDVVRDMQEGLP